MNLRGTRASVALDLMRAVAAQAVCVGHTAGLFGVIPWAEPPHVPYMQNVAVLVFFLLSGFLIAYTLATRSRDPDYGFGHYLIDRFSRVYSALIPALIFVALVDFIWMRATGTTSVTFTARAFFGSLLMLQNLVGPLAANVHSFGTAGQLWTLAIEWHLYILVGALFFVRRSLWMPLIAIAACTEPLAHLGYVPGQDFGHGLTTLWLMGFAGFFALPYLATVSTATLVCAGVASLALYFALVNPGLEYQLSTYPLLALGFLAIVSIASRFRASAEGVASKIRFAAAYSFTLYLIHNTIAKAVFRLWQGDPYVATVITIIGANALSIVIAFYTEMRHRELASTLLRWRDHLWRSLSSSAPR